MKKIIGVVGEIGAGKDTFCEYVKNNYPNVYFLRFSDSLTEVLKIFFNEVRREDQQWLSQTLRQKFGGDILLKALNKKIENIKEGIIILNGVRREDDVAAVRNIMGKIIYITADEKVRWERVRVRGEKVDDDVPFEKFQEMGKAEAEQQITAVGKTADFVVNNNGTKEEFYAQVKGVLDKI